MIFMSRQSEKMLILSVCLLLVVGIALVVCVRWYDDLYHWYVVKTTPRGLSLLTLIENNKEVSVSRVRFLFSEDVHPDDVYLQVGNSYYIPLYNDRALSSYFHPAGTWWYAVLVDELPTSGAIYFRTDSTAVRRVPFVATPEEWDIHVTGAATEGEYQVKVQEFIPNL